MEINSLGINQGIYIASQPVASLGSLCAGCMLRIMTAQVGAQGIQIWKFKVNSVLRLHIVVTSETGAQPGTSGTLAMAMLLCYKHHRFVLAVVV